jgi:hypothetical protein
LPAIANIPADTLVKVVSEAWPIFKDPTPNAVEVDATIPDKGKPEQLVNVPADGTPMFGVVKVNPAKVSALEPLFKAILVVPIYKLELPSTAEGIVPANLEASNELADVK